jgi:hypothetical protein
VKKEFIVNRQGKDFVLYAGLLDQAHREGLKRITTKLVQAPLDENSHLAICYAEVETEKGVFSGIGDASPDNVGRMIATHIVRMAETRAKARALRDAINVGVTALEELGDADDDTSEALPRAMSTRAPVRPMVMSRRQESTPQLEAATPAISVVADPAAGSANPATPQQIASLQKLQIALGRPTEVPGDLTTEQAAAQISELVRIFNSQSRSNRAQAR